MEYNKIIAVTGLPGLYELLSSKSDGAIVRSLDDKTTRFVASRVHNFSHLESIEVYTVRDNVNLVDILQAMEASATKLPDEKDGVELKSYFTKVYPDLDFTRVYSSDLKKMVKWFSVLKANNIEIKLSEEALEEEGGEEEVEVVEEKTAAHGMKEKTGKEKAATHGEKTTAHAEKAVKEAKTTAKKEEAPEAEKPKAKKAVAADQKTTAEKTTAEKTTAKEKTSKAEKAAPAEKVAATAKKKSEKKEDPAAEKPKKAAKKK
jgi:hypothetical protein